MVQVFAFEANRADWPFRHSNRSPHVLLVPPSLPASLSRCVAVFLNIFLPVWYVCLSVCSSAGPCCPPTQSAKAKRLNGLATISAGLVDVGGAPVGTSPEEMGGVCTHRIYPRLIHHVHTLYCPLDSVRGNGQRGSFVWKDLCLDSSSIVLRHFLPAANNVVGGDSVTRTAVPAERTS